MAPQLLTRIGETGGLVAVQPHPLEGQLQQCQDVRFIVHEQYSGALLLHEVIPYLFAIGQWQGDPESAAWVGLGQMGKARAIEFTQFPG